MVVSKFKVQNFKSLVSGLLVQSPESRVRTSAYWLLAPNY